MKHYLNCVFCVLMLFVIFLHFPEGDLTAQILWEKYEGNPVLVPGAPGEWDDYSLFPISILFDGSIYHMWYGGHDGTYPRIGYATSPDGITWTKYAGNPVLDIGEPGSWEDDRVQSPYVLFDGNTYHMWYIGQNSGIGYNRIGYATSTDRVTWTKYEGNPVLDVSPEGTWEIRGYDAPCILFDGSTYHMWYHAWVPDLYLICYATSPDGITWTKYAGNPVLDIGSNGSWDSHKVLAPDVFFDGTTYHMWYTGNATDWEDCIGYATSADGINWTKFTGNPVLKMSKAGEWDSKYICRCRILKDTATSTYKMWYGGGVIDYQAVSFGYATSPDILDVPGDFETIQVAIDAASDGNIVLVDEGTYYENINFRGKAITVGSLFIMDGDTNHINNTIIDGGQASNPDSGSVVYFVSGEDTNSVLCGFTITGGTGTQYYDSLLAETWVCGGGIFTYSSSAKLSFNNIEGNDISTTLKAAGGGVSAAPWGTSSYIILEDNNIQSNTLDATNVAAGGGVDISSNAKLFNNLISNNYCQSNNDFSFGGGIFCGSESSDRRSIVMYGNTITENISQSSINVGFGGGLAISWSTAQIENNIVSHNQVEGVVSGIGAGVRLWELGENSVIENNIISFNTSTTGVCYGGGIHVYRSDAVIQNNTISYNSGTYGGGIVCDYISNPTLINNIIYNNTAGSGNQVYLNNNNCDPDFYNCDVEGGTGAFAGPGAGANYTGTYQNNIDFDPLFADTLFHLSDSSLCIGAGIDSIQIGGTWCYCPPYDIYYNPRPDPQGSMPDIGACESPRGVPTSIKQLDNRMFVTYHLYQNYPNPFNPTTTIEFDLPQISDVKLKIYNILGRELATLVSDRLTAGSYSYEWDASNLASGVYLYRFKAGEFVETRKMVLMR